MKSAGVAALAALFAALALGPWGNLILRETIGIGLVSGVLFSLWKDRLELRARIAARDADFVLYTFGVVAFTIVGVMSLFAGAHDIGALTQA